MKGIMCCYRITGKILKSDFKGLTVSVIAFEKGITILFNQSLASKPFKFR
jgi:hypothetical protein